MESSDSLNQPPQNYLVFAILATVCCCLPFGIPAIIFASQVNTQYAAGNYNAALEASKKAKMWSLIAFSLGVMMNILLVLYYILMFILAAASSQGGGSY
jgi:NADH:ubiquinone oxidoreductase subunit 3 (subunit A)